jgi:hypothetical protein
MLDDIFGISGYMAFNAMMMWERYGRKWLQPKLRCCSSTCPGELEEIFEKIIRIGSILRFELFATFTF